MTKPWWHDLPAEFEPCGSECGRRRKHTLRWPGCDQGIRPEPMLGFWTTFRASDGNMSIGQAEIPLDALLPWSVHLTTDQRWEMLEEIGGSDNPRECIERWGRKVVHALEAESQQQEAEYWAAFRRHEEAKRAGGQA